MSQNGVLLRGQRIIIPNSLRERIVELAHGGHQGIVKTKAYIRSRVWFPDIDRVVEAKVRECLECQATGAQRVYEPMWPSTMPSGPWQEVSGDFFGPMADSKYWYVNHCDYSRWTSVDLIPSTSFDNVKKVLDRSLHLVFQPSTSQTMDRRSNHTSLQTTRKNGV